MFVKSLGNMVNHTDSFRNCSHIASDLVGLDVMDENAEGVMVAEVLESVFFQLDSIRNNYDVSDRDLKILRDDLVKNIQLLSDSFKNGDLTMAYTHLRDIRYAGTKFQLNAWYTLSRKSKN